MKGKHKRVAVVNHTTTFLENKKKKKKKNRGFPAKNW